LFDQELAPHTLQGTRPGPPANPALQKQWSTDVAPGSLDIEGGHTEQAASAMVLLNVPSLQGGQEG
jgi:hypothetical protein